MFWKSSTQKISNIRPNACLVAGKATTKQTFYVSFAHVFLVTLAGPVYIFLRCQLNVSLATGSSVPHKCEVDANNAHSCHITMKSHQQKNTALYGLSGGGGGGGIFSYKYN